MSFASLRGRAAGAVLASLLAAGCASTPAAAPAGDGPPIVPGEALVRAEVAPTPESLAQTMPGLVVVAVEPVFGKIFRVRFARAEGEAAPVDESFTRSVVAAFSKADGVITSEPNVVEQPRTPPENPQASENP